MWYFNSLATGQVGPMDGLSAAQFARMNPGAHCWRLGFISWLPVKAVAQFGGAAPTALDPRPGPVADDIDFQIFGDDAQYVVIELDPGESAISRAALLIHMDSSVVPFPGDDTHGAAAGLLCFTHKGQGKAKVALSATLPGAVAAVDLAEFEGRLITTTVNFLGAAKGAKVLPYRVEVAEGKGDDALFCELQGDGWAFLHVGGTAIERTLDGTSSLIVNAASIAAMTPGLTLDPVALPSGQGAAIFLKVGGKGRLWLESLSGLSI